MLGFTRMRVAGLVVVVVGGDRRGHGRSAAPRRVVDGQRVRVVARRRYVYFALIPNPERLKSLRLEQLSVATRRERFIALGEQPAVSPDGRRLAYASGEDRTATVTVRDAAR